MIEWQFADLDSKCADMDFCAPESVGKHLPTWYKDIKGDIKKYFPPGFGRDHTARYCLGLHGLASVGYTSPLPMDLTTFDYDPNPLGDLNLHPATLSGTKWCNPMPGAPVDEHLHNYEWNLRLLEWPWRAKLPKGWRLLITGYMLDWTDDWYCFSGSPPAIAAKIPNRTKKYSQTLDPKFDYFSLEFVVAIRNGVTIPKGTCMFTAIPIPPGS